MNSLQFGLILNDGSKQVQDMMNAHTKNVCDLTIAIVSAPNKLATDLDHAVTGCDVDSVMSAYQQAVATLGLETDSDNFNLEDSEVHLKLFGLLATKEAALRSLVMAMRDNTISDEKTTAEIQTQFEQLRSVNDFLAENDLIKTEFNKVTPSQISKVIATCSEVLVLENPEVNQTLVEALVANKLVDLLERYLRN